MRNAMLKKFIIATVAVAFALALSSGESAARKRHRVAKAPACTLGQECTERLDKVGRVTGWASVKTCSTQGKMFRTPFPCYAPSGACPPVTCRSTKK
jgi:hypothetical protein